MTLEFVKKKKEAATAKLVTSACGGSLVLAKGALLDGKTATTFREFLDRLQEICHASTAVLGRTKHWVLVEDGDVFHRQQFHWN